MEREGSTEMPGKSWKNQGIGDESCWLEMMGLLVDVGTLELPECASYSGANLAQGCFSTSPEVCLATKTTSVLL